MPINLSNADKLFFKPSLAKTSMISLLGLINEFQEKCFDFPLNCPVCSNPVQI